VTFAEADGNQYTAVARALSSPSDNKEREARGIPKMQKKTHSGRADWTVYSLSLERQTNNNKTKVAAPSHPARIHIRDSCCFSRRRGRSFFLQEEATSLFFSKF
jgi:hypothetical protein